LAKSGKFLRRKKEAFVDRQWETAIRATAKAERLGKRSLGMSSKLLWEGVAFGLSMELFESIGSEAFEFVTGRDLRNRRRGRQTKEETTKEAEEQENEPTDNRQDSGPVRSQEGPDKGPEARWKGTKRETEGHGTEERGDGGSAEGKNNQPKHVVEENPKIRKQRWTRRVAKGTKKRAATPGGIIIRVGIRSRLMVRKITGLRGIGVNGYTASRRGSGTGAIPAVGTVLGIGRMNVPTTRFTGSRVPLECGVPTFHGIRSTSLGRSVLPMSLRRIRGGGRSSGLVCGRLVLVGTLLAN